MVLYEHRSVPGLWKRGVSLFYYKRGTHLVFKPHAFLSFGKSPIPAKEGKNKCQNSRLVFTKCSLVCQANNTSQGQTLFSSRTLSWVLAKVQIQQKKVKNKCQNSRLVLTKCSLVCQANNTRQGQTLFFVKMGTDLVFVRRE